MAIFFSRPHIRLLSLAVAMLIGEYCSVASAAESAAMSSVQIRGSGTVLNVLQPLAESYMSSHPGRRIVLSGGGSWWGVKSVIDGSADIGMTSWGGLPADLKGLAADRHVSLEHTLLARDAVIPIVHPANPIRDVSLLQLRDLFRGVTVDWKTLGGAKEAVLVGSGDTRSGTFEIWNEKVLGEGSVITPTAKMLRNDDLQTYAATNKGVIAYTGLGRKISGVTSITVNGIAATPETVRNGSYPILRDLDIYYRADAPAEVRDFMRFLGSAEAAVTIRHFNAIPMSKETQENP
jgi:phosphate transport system substrate-binding protein